MTIKLYVCSSDPKSVNKILTDEHNISGVAKDPLDMINPVIEVEGDIVALLGKYNYMYIEDFARYYFITISGESYKLNTITGHCDVLYTGRNWLKQRQATINRNEALYNAYLEDTNFSSYAYTNIVLKKFPNAVNLDSIVLMTVG